MGLLNSTRVSAVVGGKEIVLETGRLARQANGAIWVQFGCPGKQDGGAELLPLPL